jgi:iron(III) transport system permease protein
MGWRDLLASAPLQHAVIVGTIIVILCFLAAYPLGMLFYGSLHTTQPGLPGEFSLSGYVEVFTPANLRILSNTVVISLLHTGLSLLLAIPLAWIIARTDTPGRGVLEVLITLPFFIPPILTATAWAMLGNPKVGIINVGWEWLTGATAPLIDVYSYAGIVWHMMQYSTPFLFLFIVEGFRGMDPSLEDASRLSGAARWTTFRRITLVLLGPVLTSCFLLSFMRGLESFDSALIFGYPAHILVLTTKIYLSINQTIDTNYQFSTALSFVTMVLMVALVAVQWLMLRGRSFQTVTGKGFTPRLIRLGRWRWATFAFCMLFFVLTVLLPIGQLVTGSVFQYFGIYGWSMLTLDHWREVLSSPQIWQSARNTVFLALTGATATMALGSVIAYVSARTHWRGRRVIDALAWLPWMMPGMVLGVGFLWAFAVLPGWVPLYGTIWALFLAYIALGTPISVRVMVAAYAQLSFDLEESSRISGAGWLRTLWRIVIALAWPSFMVGWVLLFFGIMRELSASVLLASAGSQVLSVTMLRLWNDGRVEEVSVIGLTMMLFVIFFRLVQHVFFRRAITIA